MKHPRESLSYSILAYPLAATAKAKLSNAASAGIQGTLERHPFGELVTLQIGLGA